MRPATRPRSRDFLGTPVPRRAGACGARGAQGPRRRGGAQRRPRPSAPRPPRWGRPGGSARFLRARRPWARSCRAEPGRRAGAPTESAPGQPPGRAAAAASGTKAPAAAAAMKPGPPHRAGAAHGAGAGAGAAAGPGARGLLLPPLLLLLLAGRAAGVSASRSRAPRRPSGSPCLAARASRGLVFPPAGGPFPEGGLGSRRGSGRGAALGVSRV